ncbi:MAG: hypothetical protein J0M02_13140 [Planctomycetes bacterium]|nr:hypothetical protein [Planctomycetota bacterium]
MAVWGKDVERLARAFVKQKLPLDYVRHYLMEHYQLDKKSVEELLLKIGATVPPTSGGKGPVKPGDDGKVKKQSFF